MNEIIIVKENNIITFRNNFYLQKYDENYKNYSAEFQQSSTGKMVNIRFVDLDANKETTNNT